MESDRHSLQHLTVVCFVLRLVERHLSFYCIERSLYAVLNRYQNIQLEDIYESGARGQTRSPSLSILFVLRTLKY